MAEPDLAPDDLAVITRLETMFRLLAKRLYLASIQALRARGGGLDRARISLLAALDEDDDRRPSDVAAAVDLDLSTVSRQLRELEQAKLIVRRADPDDGRAQRLSLSPAGRESLALVRAERAAMLSAVLADWPAAERAELLRLLDRLLDSLTA